MVRNDSLWGDGAKCEKAAQDKTLENTDIRGRQRNEVFKETLEFIVKLRVVSEGGIMDTKQRVFKNEAKVLNATKELGERLNVFTGFDNWKVVCDLNKSGF